MRFIDVLELSWAAVHRRSDHNNHLLSTESGPSSGEPPHPVVRADRSLRLATTTNHCSVLLTVSTVRSQPCYKQTRQHRAHGCCAPRGDRPSNAIRGHTAAAAAAPAAAAATRVPFAAAAAAGPRAPLPARRSSSALLLLLYSSSWLRSLALPLVRAMLSSVARCTMSLRLRALTS